MFVKPYRKLIISVVAILVAAFVIAAFATPAFAKSEANNEAKRAVPFSEVNVDQGFMHDYIKLVICKVIPKAIENVEKEEGGMFNIRNCAAWHKAGSKPTERPEHKGALYVDSDVHKVLESMCMALDTPSGGDAEIEAAQTYISGVLEDWINSYVWAPEQDMPGVEYPGYFDTYWELDPTYARYSNPDNHELYCQGHFIEAAVAHYRYQMHKNPDNPDDRLLKVALNSADHLVKTFGPADNQRHQIPGHEEIELALIKLAKLYREINATTNYDKAQGYIDTAAYFLEMRGHDYDKRTADKIILGKREYDQDHARVEDQTEAVGHAVRAQYLYTGMCELATVDQRYAAKYDNALRALWDDLTNKKQYLTGGVGDSSGHNEGFSEAYFLPNYMSYCETCAGVANMLWNRSMSTLYEGSKYADQVETDLYNNILGCVNFAGDKFYYENRLCTTKAFDRSTWFGTACCPPNFTRTILQVGGYIYNTTSNAIYINQYVSNKANFSFGDNHVNVDMKSGFPYKGEGEIKITPDSTGNFDVYLRNPNWSDNYTIKVDGATVTPKEVGGYLVISGHTWQQSGSTITFNFDMPVKYEKNDSHVKETEGLIALRHGPLLYCSEEVDYSPTDFNFNKASIDQSGTYSFKTEDLTPGNVSDNGVSTVDVMTHEGNYVKDTGLEKIQWRLIPYYARCNRTLGEMHAFFHDGELPPKLSQKATPSSSFSSTTAFDSVWHLNDCTEEPDLRWTSYNGDTVEPNPWVQYDFTSPVKINAIRIWWYDDNGGVRMPNDFNIEVGGNTQENNKNETAIITNKTDPIVDGNYKIYTLDKAYEGTYIKLLMDNSVSQKAAGIVEWQLLNTQEDTYTVNFNLNGHGTTSVESQSIKYGEKVTPVTDPEETGYTFEGWYADGTLTTPWNFASDAVKSDMTLYAKWTQQTTSVSGSVVWDDANNQDGFRPTTAKINLLSNDEVVDGKIVAENVGWAFTFSNLPKYTDGKLNTYTVSEDPIDEYTITSSGSSFTNTHIPEKIDIPLKVKFNVAPGVPLPDEIVVELVKTVPLSLASVVNEDTGICVTLNAANDWTASFDNLDKYQDGKEIIYSLKPHPVEGFDIDFSGDWESGFTVNIKVATPVNPVSPESVNSATGDATIPMSSLLILIAVAGTFVLINRRRKISRY